MIDREKVIGNLTSLRERLKWQKDIQGYGVYISFVDDAIDLLKEQEKPNDKCVNECECWDSAYERGKQDALKEQEVKIEHLKRPDCEHAEHDGIGCLGYAGCTQDDEPIDACKECEKYTGNVFEEVKWND